MRPSGLCLVLLFALAGWSTALEPEKANRAVLYIGTPSNSRGKAYTQFLTQHFRLVKGAERKGFSPQQALAFDVVLLDWSQDERPAKPTSPLGPRETWGKPTVLLGSAGLLLAETWDIHGAIG
jgi:hypothetical protein